MYLVLPESERKRLGTRNNVNLLLCSTVSSFYNTILYERLLTSYENHIHFNVNMTVMRSARV